MSKLTTPDYAELVMEAAARGDRRRVEELTQLAASVPAPAAPPAPTAQEQHDQYLEQFQADLAAVAPRWTSVPLTDPSDR